MDKRPKGWNLKPKIVSVHQIHWQRENVLRNLLSVRRTENKTRRKIMPKSGFRSTRTIRCWVFTTFVWICLKKLYLIDSGGDIALGSWKSKSFLNLGPETIRTISVEERTTYVFWLIYISNFEKLFFLLFEENNLMCYFDGLFF